MALQTDLMGLGMPGPLANLLGNATGTIAGVGTAQATAAILTSSMAKLTTGSGQTAFVFRSTTTISRLFFLYNSSATTALIFPPVGGTIVGQSQDASFSLAQNKSVIFWHFDTNTYVALLTA